MLVLVALLLFFTRHHQGGRYIEGHHFNAYFPEYFAIKTQHERGIMELDEFTFRAKEFEAFAGDTFSQRFRQHDEWYP